MHDTCVGLQCPQKIFLSGSSRDLKREDKVFSNGVVPGGVTVALLPKKILGMNKSTGKPVPDILIKMERSNAVDLNRPVD